MVVLRKATRRPAGGFSLIEVTLAIGIVAFALVPILALLPIGLQASRNAANMMAIANISQQIQGELQQIPFSGANSVRTLPGQSLYYKLSGAATTASDKEAYYRASFVLPSADDAVPGAPTTYGANAQIVQITVRYPQNIPASVQKTSTFFLFAARQASN